MAQIRHLAIISDNRERLVEFYTKAFGMKQIESTGPAIYLTAALSEAERIVFGQCVE